VNYLGLSQDLQLKEIQTKNYSELLEKYEDVKEKFNILSREVKDLRDENTKVARVIEKLNSKYKLVPKR
jgi:predicted nuclease with TOPRIM domain